MRQRDSKAGKQRKITLALFRIFVQSREVGVVACQFEIAFYAFNNWFAQQVVWIKWYNELVVPYYLVTYIQFDDNVVP